MTDDAALDAIEARAAHPDARVAVRIARKALAEVELLRAKAAADFAAAHEAMLAYRCHRCGAPHEGAPLQPDEQHLVDELLRGAP